MICRNYQNGQKLDVAGLNEITVLIDRSETQLTEVGWNSWRKGLEGPPLSHDAKEQIFYVTDGEGTVVVGQARYLVKAGKHVEDIHRGPVFDFGSNTSTLLLDRTESRRSEVTLVTWPQGSQGAVVAHKEKEQTFFVLSGRGQVTIADETSEVGVGDVVFVPWNRPHTTVASDVQLSYLCFNTLVIDPPDKTFAESYQRVAGDRIARWRSGEATVGE